MAMILWFAQSQVTIQGGAKVATVGAAPTLQAITIAPSVTSIQAGSQVSFVATGTAVGGGTSNVTSSCLWNSSNTAVATVVSPGNILAVSPGSTSITCMSQNITGVAQLTVTSVLSIQPTVAPSGLDGQAYTVSFTTSGGTSPYGLTIINGLSQLQAIGLSFTSPTLSGTLTASSMGSYGFTLQATDASTPPHVATQSYVLVVNSATGPSRVAVKPQEWANPHEADLPVPCDAPHNCYTKRIRTNGTGDYACSLAGLNSLMNDWITTAPNVWWHVIVDDALSTGTGGRCVINTGAGWTWKAKTTGKPTAFLVVESEHPDPRFQTVCNHMTGIPLTGRSQRNPGCNTTFDDTQHMFALWSQSGTSAGPVIDTGAAAATYGVCNIVIRDAEMYITNWPNGNGNTPIEMKSDNTTVGDKSLLPCKLGIEYSYMHSDTDSLGRGTAAIANYLYIMCHLCWFDWNYFDKISRNRNCNPDAWNTTCFGGEGHLFSTTNAYGVKIAHNFAEGSEVGNMAGGVTPQIRIPPEDLEIRNNVFTMDPAWMRVRPGTNEMWRRCNVQRKNPFEFKEVKRALLNGNVFEYGIGCAQSGQGFTITVRAFNSGNDWATIEDITFTNNVQRHTNEGVQGSGRSGVLGNGSFMSFPGRRWFFSNNLFYDQSTTPQGSDGTWAGQAGNSGSTFSWGGSVSTNFTCATASRDISGTIATLSDCTPIDRSLTGPGGAAGNGNSRTLQAVGDPTFVFNCADTSFNTNQATTAAASRLGPPSLPGTNGTDLTTLPIPPQTIVYPNAGTPLATTTDCRFGNMQGWPSEVTLSHNTYVFDTRPIVYTANGPANPNCQRTRGATIRDELYIPIGSASPYYVNNVCPPNGVTAGAGIRLGFDVDSLIFNNIVLPGAAGAASWFAYPPPPNGIAGGQPGGNIWTPGLAAVVCPGPTADATCLGISGFMNGNPKLVYPGDSVDPLTFYALHPTSVYKAGGSRQASDGTDMGADMNKIRQAMQETQYSGCAPGECGAGPYPD